jgi:hypothetical protein
MDSRPSNFARVQPHLGVGRMGQRIRIALWMPNEHLITCPHCLIFTPNVDAGDGAHSAHTRPISPKFQATPSNNLDRLLLHTMMLLYVPIAHVANFNRESTKKL